MQVPDALSGTGTPVAVGTAATEIANNDAASGELAMYVIGEGWLQKVGSPPLSVLSDPMTQSPHHRSLEAVYLIAVTGLKEARK